MIYIVWCTCSFHILFSSIVCVYYVWTNVGGEDKTIAFLKREGGSGSGQSLLHHTSEKGIIHHHFPVNYVLKPWRLGTRFYLIIKFGIFQYVFLQALEILLLEKSKTRLNYAFFAPAGDHKDPHSHLISSSRIFWCLLWWRIQFTMWVRQLLSCSLFPNLKITSSLHWFLFIAKLFLLNGIAMSS